MRLTACFTFVLSVASVAAPVTHAHEGHSHAGHRHAAASTPTAAQTETTPAPGAKAGKEDQEAANAENAFTANGKRYRWEHRPELGTQSDAMKAAAKGSLHNNADQDTSTGEIVTVVARHGLVTLGADLKAWKLLENQDPVFAAGMNSHGVDCFEMEGQSYWAFASTNTGEVVVSQRGSVIAQLGTPDGTEFDNPDANDYFANGGKFTPCDVVFLPAAKRLAVVTGYTPGDYLISATVRDGKWQWGGPAWGGKENKGGPFNTAHGVEVASKGGKEIVEVASRGHGRLYAFTADGAQIRMPDSNAGSYIQLPPKSNPCNISHYETSVFLPLLNPLADTKGLAPVMSIEGGKPTGNLVPATYDGLEFMRHMHGFRAIEKDGKLFGIVLSWPNGGENKRGKRNDGQIAIFEAVEQ